MNESKHEIQNRLDIEKQKLSKIQQNITNITKYGDTDPFNLNDINQPADVITLDEFLDTVESNKTKNHTTPVFDVIVDSQRDNYPFIING